MDCLASTLKDRILSQKCAIHAEFLSDMLNIDAKTEQHRVCSICIEEQQIPKKQIISIESLINLDPSTKFPIFPLEQDLLQLLESDFDLETISNEVEIYFNELKDKIRKALDRMFDFESQQIQKMISSCKKSQMSLRNLLSIKEIQQLLASEEPNAASEMHQLIEKHCLESEKEIIGIKKTFSEIDAFQRSYSIKQESKIPDQLLSLIDKINLFNGKSARSWKFPWLNKCQIWNEGSLSCVASVDFKNSMEDLDIQSIGKTIVIKNKTNNFKQCYLSNQLLPEHIYQIRVEINNQSDQSPYFYFGLITPQDRDSKDLCYSTSVYYRQTDGGWTTTVKSGDALHSEAIRIGKLNLEFKIHIKKQLWEVSSFPDYLNVSELDNPYSIKADQLYHFAIQLGNENDTVTILEVLEFD